jgi:dihydrolipoamide dehydrogenase
LSNKYDVIVIGAGSAGYPCAIRLGQLKRKVLVVEEKELGGLCLNWGCIPTKALLFAAELTDQIEKAKRIGLRVENQGFDLDALRNWKEGISKRLRSGVSYLFKHSGVQYMPGRARVISDHKVEVVREAKTEIVEAEHIVLATGTEVIPLPGFNFDGRYVTHTDHALALTDIPSALLVIGAGAAGLEMATVFSRLGSKVTVVEIMSQILPGMESELCEALRQILQKSGLDILLNSSVSSYRIEGGKVEASIQRPGAEIAGTFDRILVTVGRRPVPTVIKDAQPDVDDKGYIAVNADCRTSIGNIFAIGDVTGPPLLAHKATFQGVRCAEAIAGMPSADRPPAIPSCVFTLPSLSSVGMTESEAKAKGYRVKIGRFPFRLSGKALAMDEPEGMVKLIADDQDRIIGVHILGVESTSLIGEGVLAVDRGLTAGDIASAVHPHPTLSEILMEAAATILKKSINIVN